MYKKSNFFAHENMKKLPSKVGYLKKLKKLSLTALISQNCKFHLEIWPFNHPYMYLGLNLFQLDGHVMPIKWDCPHLIWKCSIGPDYKWPWIPCELVMTTMPPLIGKLVKEFLENYFNIKWVWQVYLVSILEETKALVSFSQSILAKIRHCFFWQILCKVVCDWFHLRR